MKKTITYLLMFIGIVQFGLTSCSKEDDTVENQSKIVEDNTDVVFEATINDVKITSSKVNALLETKENVFLISTRINNDEDLIQILIPGSIKKDNVVSLEANDDANVSFIPNGSGFSILNAVSGSIVVSELDETNQIISIDFSANLEGILTDETKKITSGKVSGVSYVID